MSWPQELFHVPSSRNFYARKKRRKEGVRHTRAARRRETRSATGRKGSEVGIGRAVGVGRGIGTGSGSEAGRGFGGSGVGIERGV